MLKLRKRSVEGHNEDHVKNASLTQNIDMFRSVPPRWQGNWFQWCGAGTCHLTWAEAGRADVPSAALTPLCMCRVDTNV